MTVSFVAANDVALPNTGDYSSLMELKSQWLGYYREILELVQEDKAESFKEAKSLWTDICSFTKPKSTKSDVTRSVIELRDAVMKLMLSLALDIEEHQFIIDTCLKSVDTMGADLGLWDTLGKAMVALGTFTPAALRLVFEKQVAMSPPGSISAKSRLYQLLESLGDYEGLHSANDKAKDMLFFGQDHLLVPKYDRIAPEQVVFEQPRVRTAVLHERTWTALLIKLVHLYEDDSMHLNQPLRITVTQDEPVLSQLTKDMNTLAMSFSRRPSIEDLATRTSKRRKDTGNGGSAPKKTKLQQYEELELEGFFQTSLGVSEEGLLRLMSKVHQPNVGHSGQEFVPLDFFTDCQEEYKAKGPTLVSWIRFALNYIDISNAPIEPGCAAPYLTLSDSQPQSHGLKRCYALCSSKPEGYQNLVRETLSRIESTMVNSGQFDFHASFECHYRFILGLISDDSTEALFHFNCCKSKLSVLGDLIGFCCFGFTIDTASMDHLIAKIMFKTKLDAMRQHMHDPSWFKVHLFDGADLIDPTTCLEQISATDLHDQIILSTLEMLFNSGLQGKGHRWLSHGFQLAMEKHVSSQMISSFLKLSEFALRLASASTLDKSLVDVLVICSLLLRDGAEYEDKENISSVLVRLWPVAVTVNKSFSEFAWKFLSIGLSKSTLTEFLRNLSAVKGLPTTLAWNALRVLNGINSPFHDSDDPLGQMEPIGTLDMKKTSVKSFEKIYMPLETLCSLLAYQKEYDVADDAKYAELLEYLTTGLGRSCSSIVKTNTGILERHITSSIQDCFQLKKIKLFTGNDLDAQVGKGLYKRVKHLDSLFENKKRNALLVRGWRDDLVKSLCCHESSKSWYLLCELSLDVIDLELSEDMYHINDIRDDLLRDVRIALVSLTRVKEKGKWLATLFLLLLEGPIQFLCKDDGLSCGVLQKLFLQSVQPTSEDPHLVLNALIQAANGHPEKQMALILAVIKAGPANMPYEQRYHLALSLLELSNDYPHLSDPMVISAELVRLGLIGEDQNTLSIAEWATEIGSRDKKQVQHRHVFLIAQIESSLNSWSALFPFLTKSKSAGFINVWKCEQDFPGQHLCYKAKYTNSMLSWLAAHESAELYTIACKKTAANLSDMYNPDGIVSHALSLLAVIKARLPEVDLVPAFNALKNSCDDKDQVARLRSELNLV